MTISVVVPVYKVEAYLSRCVDSILRQSFSDFELILVDDGSPDRCGEYCDAYERRDSRVRVIHQENGGLSAARNSGIAIAQGQWITFIDSDDWIHPDYLRLLYDGVSSNGVKIAVGRYAQVSDNTQVDDSAVAAKAVLVEPEELWVSRRTNATVAWAKLYHKSLFDTVRFPVGKYHEDEYVTYKLLFGCQQVAFVDAPIYRYYYNNASISRLNYLKRLPDIQEAFGSHEAFFQGTPWKQAYRLEVEKYAEVLSNAIWLLKKHKDQQSKAQTKELRAQLKDYLRQHKGMILFEQRKDIYIAAYPGHEFFIRGLGFIKQKMKKVR